MLKGVRINGAGDPKSEKAKCFLRAIVKFSKKARKVSPRVEVAFIHYSTKNKEVTYNSYNILLPF